MNKKDPQMKTATSLSPYYQQKIILSQPQVAFQQLQSLNTLNKEYQNQQFKSLQQFQLANRLDLNSKDKNYQKQSFNKLHHDHMKITSRGIIIQIQNLKENRQSQQKLMSQVIQHNRQLISFQHLNTYQKRAQEEKSQLKQDYQHKKIFNFKQPKQPIFQIEEFDQINIFHKIFERSRLNQALKNIHLFYQIEIQRLRQIKKSNDYLFLNVLRENKAVHQQKKKLIKACISQQKTNKMVASESQRHLSYLSSSMEKAIQVSVEQKQKNQLLNQNITENKRVLLQKTLTVQKLKRQLEQKQSIIKQIQNQKSKVQINIIQINELLFKNNLKERLLNFQQ